MAICTEREAEDFVRCVVCSISRTQVTRLLVTCMVRLGKVSIITHKNPCYYLWLSPQTYRRECDIHWQCPCFIICKQITILIMRRLCTSETVGPWKFIRRVAYHKQRIVLNWTVLLWSVYKPQSGLGEDQLSIFIITAWILAV